MRTGVSLLEGSKAFGNGLLMGLGVAGPVLLFFVFLLMLGGCATTKAVSNVSEDIGLILDRVHLDAQEVIAHPERWYPAVDSLCKDGMITADQCVRLRAILKARAILVGQQSRLHPSWKLRRATPTKGPMPRKPDAPWSLPFWAEMVRV